MTYEELISCIKKLLSSSIEKGISKEEIVRAIELIDKTLLWEN